MGGCSGCNDRGACLVSGWVCQSITSMPSSPHPQEARPTAPTYKQVWGSYPGPSLTNHQTGHAGGCSRQMWEKYSCLLQYQSGAQCWSVSTGPACGRKGLIPPHSLFLTVWVDTCTWGACWRSVFMVPPVSPCTKEPVCRLSAAVLLTSLSSWYNISI